MAVYLSDDGNAYEVDAMDERSIPRNLGNTCKEVIRNVGFDALPHLMILCCHYLESITIENESDLDFLEVFPDCIAHEPMWRHPEFVKRIEDMGYSREETEDLWRREIGNFRKSCMEAYRRSSDAFKAGGDVTENNWLSFNENALLECHPYEDLEDMTMNWHSFIIDRVSHARRIGCKVTDFTTNFR